MEDQIGNRASDPGPVDPLAAASAPGPASIPEAIASVVILLVTAALVVLAPWDRLPAWCDVTVRLLYTASALPLAQAARGRTPGS